MTETSEIENNVILYSCILWKFIIIFIVATKWKLFIAVISNNNWMKNKKIIFYD